MDAVPNSGPTTVSDADRETTIRRLTEAVGAGHLELEEFSDRVDQALVAVDHASLAVATTGLPVVASAAPPADTPQRSSSWILGIMGGGNRSGRWRVAERVRVLNIMGGADLDLRGAFISAPVTKITIFSVMGGSAVTVPEGIHAALSGFAVMGGNRLKVEGPPPSPTAPTIVVRAFSIMGGTRVRTDEGRHRERRELRDAERRERRELRSADRESRERA